ncbi:MAG: class I SAM-dependent methyltransferase [Deltaproteobacteria bacterium]|nr:class I SAM-dependent methyltransferase [Deltaproteobacteria bacterium]
MSEWFADDAFWASFQVILFSPERLALTGEEVDGMEALCGLAPGDEVLDLACGPGRHALELARRGYRVTGVDLSGHYLRQLRDQADGEGLPVVAVEADMRHFERPNAFDAVIHYFTSFGYFDDPSDDLRVLERAHRSLRPGGRLLVDVLGKEVVARGFPQRWWKWLDDGRLLLEEREVRDAWTRMDTRWTVLRGADIERFGMSHRLYSAAELAAAMAAVGFGRVEVFGSLAGAPYDASAWRLIAIATRSLEQQP